ncbi:MAG: hypothetical protein IT371_23505 [Deltaproteobacteria bacterium]|nr:hypothetical protein [Deltaproteobacteria bacterium]
MSRFLVCCVLVGPALSALGCGGETASGTGILLAVTFGPELSVDQLRIRPAPRGEEGAGPRFVPEAARTLASGVKVELLLPDAWAGRWVDVTVEGLRQGTGMGRGQASVELESGRLASLGVQLNSASCPEGCSVGERRCNEAGVELCEPDARGCGAWGSTRACEGGQRCQGTDAKCRPTTPSCAVPQCGERVCGPDPVCGLSCGACEAGSCTASGQCVVTPPPPPPPPTGSWTAVASGTTKRLDGVWGGSRTDILIVSSEGVILRSTNGGPAYPGGSFIVEAHPKSLSSIWGDRGSQLWTVGAGGTIELFDGVSWSTANSPTTDSLYHVHGSGPSHVFAVGSGGRVVGYDGSSWKASPLPGVGQLYGVWADQGFVWAVGGTSGTQGNVVLNSSGYAGGSFAKSHTASAYLYGVWGSSSSDVWMVGASGLLVRYKNGTYSSQAAPVAKHLNAIWGTDASDIWAVGAEGVAVHYDGTSWRKVSTPTSKGLLAVHGSSSTDVWAVGLDGTVLHYR